MEILLLQSLIKIYKEIRQFVVIVRWFKCFIRCLITGHPNCLNSLLPSYNDSQPLGIHYKTEKILLLSLMLRSHGHKLRIQYAFKLVTRSHVNEILMRINSI